jgi:two-component system, NtrC family, response regulator HydG
MKEPANILVVDDNRDLLNTFSLILKRKGYIVDTAEDGLLAIEKFKNNHFDLVLMDVVMPNMNGIDALHKIREINERAKVILLTAYCEEDQLKKAVKEGAYRALYKPVNIARLMELIGEVTGDTSILVVDDDADFRNSMAKMLEIQGFQVSTAANGLEAIDLTKQRKFNIAFVDIKMSYMDGLTASIKIKENNPEILIVMMTGYREEVQDIVDEASEKGVTRCLYKPFNASELRELVDQAV